MLLTLPYPEIDPVAIQLGPIAVRWYALAYIAGFVLGYMYCVRMATTTPASWTRHPDATDVADFLTWAVIGTILGGRLGFVLFYMPQHYLANPLQVLQVWEGGMAFHGGLVGVAVAIILFARNRGRAVFAMGDLIACAAPIGLFFGRIANFINNELWGRPSDLPWAMTFPIPDHLETYFPEVPRHPSQLYEAALEGLVLFALLYVLRRNERIAARPGMLTGIFLAGYGVARFVVEFARAPDVQIGLIGGVVTMGQILSIPMVLVGVAIAQWAAKQGTRDSPADRHAG
jgi:phosphatidylglycerol:prolipoprotein diacylglycerol transferase